jgi:hypothetical protein
MCHELFALNIYKIDKVNSTMKMTAFWDTVPHSLAEADRHSEVHTASIVGCPDDGGSMHL